MVIMTGRGTGYIPWQQIGVYLDDDHRTRGRLHTMAANKRGKECEVRTLKFYLARLKLPKTCQPRIATNPCRRSPAISNTRCRLSQGSVGNAGQPRLSLPASRLLQSVVVDRPRRLAARTLIGLMPDIAGSLQH